MRLFKLSVSDEGRSTEDDRRFLALLKERAAGENWSSDTVSTYAFIAGGLEYRGLRVGISLDEDVTDRHLLAYGVVFDGKRILGDRVGSQSRDFEDVTRDRFEEKGSVPYLAEVTTRWFESLMDMPIELRQWMARDTPIYEEYVIATTDEAIIGDVGPRPVRPPDRVTLVRGVA